MITIFKVIWVGSSLKKSASVSVNIWIKGAYKIFSLPHSASFAQSRKLIERSVDYATLHKFKALALTCWPTGNRKWKLAICEKQL